jgi:quinol monooxygenase YgiN
MSRVGLYVKFKTQPDQSDALVELLLESARQMESLPGCELYLVNTSPTEADVVWVTEVWSSMAEHDASLDLPGAAEAIKRALPLLAGPPERIDVVPVGGKGLANSQP